MGNTVHQLRKEGRLNEAWETAVSLTEKNPDDRRYILELAWVYYDFLKREAGNGNPKKFLKVCRKFTGIIIEDNDTMLSEQLSWVFFKMLHKLINEKQAGFETIAKLTAMYVDVVGLSKPSLPQSLILKTLLKTRSFEGPFWNLLPWMDDEILRNEDLEPEVFDNKKIMPLAERIYYAFAKSLVTQAKAGARKALGELIGFAKTTDASTRKRKYKFADYYLAEANNLLGNNDEAVKHAVCFVKNNHQKSWAWALLAKVTGDNEKRFSFLAMSINLEHKETFLLQVRTALIAELLNRELFGAAVQNINLIIKTREENNWPVPAQIEKYKNEIWFENPPVGENLNEIVGKEAAKAFVFLFPDIKRTIALVTGKQGRKIWLFTMDGLEINYKSNQNLKPGDWIEIIKAEGKIINHNRITKPEKLSENFRCYTGTLHLQSNFGFVDNVFVAPYLVEKLAVDRGSVCRGIAIFATDRKKNKKGWKAVTAKLAAETAIPA